MTPTKEEVAEALEYADNIQPDWIVNKKTSWIDCSGSGKALRVLAASTRAFQGSAELAEMKYQLIARQYLELMSIYDGIVKHPSMVGDMLTRHERERKELQIERSHNENPQE